MPSVKVEPAALGDLASLSVRCDVRGADVWLDYQYRGQAPLDVAALSPGSHTLSVRSKGYYDAALALDLAPNTKTTISVSLKPITGYLDVTASPPGATVLIDGATASAGVTEIPAGLHEVTVKAFGYKEQTTTVFVPERLFASVRAELQPAPFDAKGFRVHPDRFNPLNAGLKGSARLAFSVTAPGTGSLVVRDPSGEVLRTESLGPFDDWEQAFSWDGRDEEGAPLPDGSYAFELSLEPLPGQASLRESYAFSAPVRIDSSLVMATSGAYGSMYGSEYAPEAFAPADSAFRVEALGLCGSSLQPAGPVSGGLRLSLSGALAPLLDLGLGFETDGTDAASRLGLRVSAPLSGPVGVAGLLEGRIASGAAGRPAFARAGASLGLGTRFLSLTLAPHAGAYWEDGFGVRAGLGAALNAGGYEFGAALSALALTGDLRGGLSLALPVRTALELRLAPPRLALSFRLVGGLDWSPGLSAWMAGVAIAGSF